MPQSVPTAAPLRGHGHCFPPGNGTNRFNMFQVIPCWFASRVLLHLFKSKTLQTHTHTTTTEKQNVDFHHVCWSKNGTKVVKWFHMISSTRLFFHVRTHHLSTIHSQCGQVAQLFKESSQPLNMCFPIVNQRLRHREMVVLCALYGTLTENARNLKAPQPRKIARGACWCGNLTKLKLCT